jgi:hypothetical protein
MVKLKWQQSPRGGARPSPECRRGRRIADTTERGCVRSPPCELLRRKYRSAGRARIGRRVLNLKTLTLSCATHFSIAICGSAGRGRPRRNPLPAEGAAAQSAGVRQHAANADRQTGRQRNSARSGSATGSVPALSATGKMRLAKGAHLAGSLARLLCHFIEEYQWLYCWRRRLPSANRSPGPRRITGKFLISGHF